MPVFYTLLPRYGGSSHRTQIGRVQTSPIRVRVAVAEARPISVRFMVEDYESLREAFVQAIDQNKIRSTFLSSTFLIPLVKRRQVNMIPFMITYLKKLFALFTRTLRTTDSTQSLLRAIEAQVDRDSRTAML